MNIYQVSKKDWIIADSWLKARALAKRRTPIAKRHYLWLIPCKSSEAALNFYEVEDWDTDEVLTVREWLDCAGKHATKTRGPFFPYPLDEQPLDCVSRLSKRVFRIIAAANEALSTSARLLQVLRTGFFYGRNGYAECRRKSRYYQPIQWLYEEAQLDTMGIQSTGDCLYSKIYAIAHRFGELIYKGP